MRKYEEMVRKFRERLRRKKGNYWLSLNERRLVLFLVEEYLRGVESGEA